MTIPDCPIVQSAVRVRDETRRDETRRDDARRGATRAMTRASPRKRASENDREAANATRRRPVPPRGRAPPLTPSDIEALNKAGCSVARAVDRGAGNRLGGTDVPSCAEIDVRTLRSDENDRRAGFTRKTRAPADRIAVRYEERSRGRARRRGDRRVISIARRPIATKRGGVAMKHLDINQ